MCIFQLTSKRKVNAMTFKRNDQDRTSIINGATDNAKRIGAMLDRIKADGESLSYLIETAALSCILCAVKHGDVNSATLLVTKTLHAGVDRSRAVATWMQLHGPMTWEAKDKAFKLNKNTRASYLENYERDPEAFKARIVDADSGPFYVLTKPSKPVSFNLFGRLQAIVKEAHKIQEGAKHVDKADIRGLEEVDSFLATLERHLRVGNPDTAKVKVPADSVHDEADDIGEGADEQAA